jgi:hypothetical protein
MRYGMKLAANQTSCISLVNAVLVDVNAALRARYSGKLPWLDRLLHHGHILKCAVVADRTRPEV